MAVAIDMQHRTSDMCCPCTTRLLVWNSPRREGVLPAGDTGELERDVVSGGRVAGTRHVFPKSEETGLGVCPGLKRRELELGRRRFHRNRST